jgi:hypothetical protein
MRNIDGIGNLVLVIMAAASLISMIAAISLGNIIDHDLPSYGLQFSYSWAIPYWNTIGIVLAMAWLNIIAAAAFQIYRIIIIRKEERQSTHEQFEKTLESNGDRTIYGITIVTDQTPDQEATEQAQIVPYQPITCKQTESKDSQQAEQ